MSDARTKCWNCKTSYPMLTDWCPKCRAVNANVAPDAAMLERELMKRCAALQAENERQKAEIGNLKESLRAARASQQKQHDGITTLQAVVDELVAAQQGVRKFIGNDSLERMTNDPEKYADGLAAITLRLEAAWEAARRLAQLPK